jgi:methionine S-methyltransferase
MPPQRGSWLIGSALPQERVHQLSRLLTKSGWEVLKPYGGLFLIATPTAHLARTFSYKTPTGLKTVQLDADNIREALYYTTGIQINSSSWMGIDKYCRFVLSIDEEKFQRVAALLERFVSCKDESS